MNAAALDGESMSGSRHAPAYEETHGLEDEIATLMEISRKLCLVEDPPSEPFRSKYKAREALTKARQLAVDTVESGLGGDEGGDAEVGRERGRATPAV